MIRKGVLNKRVVIVVASSLAAIPLTVVLIAAATRKGRRKSLQTSRFLGQTRLKKSVITTAATHSQQQKEKPQLQLQSSWQGSETNKQTATTTTTTTAATIISTNAIVDDKDITTPGVVLSPTVPSSTSDSTVTVSSSSSQTSKEEEISVSDEARKAGESLKEVVVTAIKEAKDSATGTGKQLKEQTIDIAATADSKDIRSLEDNVNALVSLFEETMIEIRKERYDEQIKLLDSYKDLLQTHIKVAAARRRMARKLKPGA